MLPEGTIAPTLNVSGPSFDDGARAVLDQAGEGPLVMVGNSVDRYSAGEAARPVPDRVEAGDR
jgi:hypothetical protein